jgi:hypothetical protein
MLEEVCLKKRYIFFLLISTLFCDMKRCFVDPEKLFL